MILVITGSRSITDYAIVCAAFDTLPYRDEISVLLSGHQPGVKIETPTGVKWVETVDLLAERWAKERGIPVLPFPAKWHENGVYNPRAGFERNADMIHAAIELSEKRKEEWACLAVWDKKSKGTAQAWKYAKKMGGDVTVYTPIAENV
jgi:hypothetical protein